MQQSEDYTCGNIASLMVMKFFGNCDETENGLAEKMHTHTDSNTPDAKPGTAINWTDYGTNVEEIYNYFNNRKDYCIVASSYNNENGIFMLFSASGKNNMSCGRDFMQCGKECTQENIRKYFIDTKQFSTEY